MSIQPTPVLEIAVFTVRAADAFPAIQHRTHAALATLRGHRASLRLRGMSDGLFADVVAWDDKPAAREGCAVPLVDLHDANLASLDALVVSPGVPLRTHPLTQRAATAGVKVIRTSTASRAMT